MRLKTIKLAGFKSFVDPTTVPFVHNLSAVVGPNGCGKSNIIDAVRWVMGESSAKHLRGESMTDVIFNGSSGRKPVGQAAIELVFDNSAGKLAGEYGRFSEISIKRRVTREGASDYFLNGTKCRRRDITDIFLGTGLGPRSYAIIEQGMISRLIESKPEELRVYIEEAAGISKYKERRRETETRMKRTQENLERLKDLRDELERQLQHLHKQALAAEKYKELKKQSRYLSAQLSAMKWQSLNEQIEIQRGEVGDLELALEREVVGRSTNEGVIDSLRQQYDECNLEFQRAQARFYETGAEIARTEQSLQSLKDRGRQQQSELVSTQNEIRELVTEQEQERDKLEEVSRELAEIAPELEAKSAEAEESLLLLESVEQEMQAWQHTWDEFNQLAATAKQSAEVQQAQIQSIEGALRRFRDGVEKLDAESSLLTSHLEEVDGEDLRFQLAELDDLIEADEAHCAQAQELIMRTRAQLKENTGLLAELRGRAQNSSGALASKKALQQAALGDENKLQMRWLEAHGLNPDMRLVGQIAVEAGWEVALESVLGDKLQGLITKDLDALAQYQLETLPETLTLVASDPRCALVDTLDASRRSLFALTRGGQALQPLLDSIYLVDSVSQALDRRHELQPHEAFVTRDGTLITLGWVRIYRPDQSHGGVLRRQSEIDQLHASLRNLQDQIAQTEDQGETLSQALSETERTLSDMQKAMTDRQRQRSEVVTRLAAITARQEQMQVRLQGIGADRADILRQQAQETERLALAREIWQEAMAAMEEDSERRESLLGQRDRLRQQLDELRQVSRHNRDQAHQLQLQLQSLTNQKVGLSRAIEKLATLHERLIEKRQSLSESLEAANEPLEELAIKLEGLLDARAQEEARLTAAREQLEETDLLVRDKEKLRHAGEQAVLELRTRLEKRRMNLQALEIHRQTVLDEFDKDSVGTETPSLPAMLETLPEDAHPQVWQEELDKLSQRITRIGAINLAAIDEYQTQGERKRFLDEQSADLMEALETLEAAIRKIDRETRARFKETFDKVNGGLQALFPKVFGGGMAYLDLTGDDLLETGVTIMARPPGKKNATIHLLSGGEKALTAIALIFSIFQLNPAPFCMLDEVDAPLDDANVGRYANMVKEMSEQVQFIYITHNKIAMEMADQLMGVTMHEPGVSRLVSVDVEEAAALAAM